MRLLRPQRPQQPEDARPVHEDASTAVEAAEASTGCLNTPRAPRPGGGRRGEGVGDAPAELTGPAGGRTREREREPIEMRLQRLAAARIRPRPLVRPARARSPLFSGRKHTRPLSSALVGTCRVDELHVLGRACPPQREGPHVTRERGSADMTITLIIHNYNYNYNTHSLSLSLSLSIYIYITPA